MGAVESVSVTVDVVEDMVVASLLSYDFNDKLAVKVRTKEDTKKVTIS